MSSRKSRALRSKKFNSMPFPSTTSAPAGSGGGYGTGNPTSVDGGGYGVSLPNAQPASGQSPRANPFMQPKPMGLTHFSQTFPNNYFVEWNLTTWRYACEQVMRTGQALSYATLVTWAYQCSPFIQMLFAKRGTSIDQVEIFIADQNGNRIDELTIEMCTKPWEKQLFREIDAADMWGFSGINFDPLAGKCYRYPMQQVDPINRMVKDSTYAYYDGILFSDHANLLFVQPSTNDEAFLGKMQAITRRFIMMNQSSNNWVSAGRRLAFPVMTVGYPQNSSAIDPNNEDAQINPFKVQAELIASEIDPSKGFVYPYTQTPGGEIQKAIEIDFAETKSGQNMFKVYSEFNEVEKNDIRELILGATLSTQNDGGGSGSRALGEVHERMYKAIMQSRTDFVLSVLNEDYKPKIEIFYKGLPKGWRFDIDRSQRLTYEEMTSLSQVVSQNGKRLTTSFFVANGVPEDFIEDAPEPVAPMKGGKPVPDPDPAALSVGIAKKKSWF